jgi:hypothetical protein
MTAPGAELPFSPAADRNKGPLLDLLSRLLPAQASVLEVASGTAQHAAHCAAARPGWQWWPSEATVEALPPIAARCAGLPNVQSPLPCNVLAPGWASVLPAAGFDALLAVNLLHIAPWAACAGLMQGAATLLAPTGLLLVYGPFVVDGQATAESNLAFDADLRRRDARWGLRTLGDVQAVALAAGLGLAETVAMPANNLSLVFRR